MGQGREAKAAVQRAWRPFLILAEGLVSRVYRSSEGPCLVSNRDGGRTTNQASEAYGSAQAGVRTRFTSTQQEACCSAESNHQSSTALFQGGVSTLEILPILARLSSRKLPSAITFLGNRRSGNGSSGDANRWDKAPNSWSFHGKVATLAAFLSDRPRAPPTASRGPCDPLIRYFFSDRHFSYNRPPPAADKPCGTVDSRAPITSIGLLPCGRSLRSRCPCCS